MNDPDGFEANGLFFREWRAEDAEAVAALFDTEQMNRVTGLASPFTVEAARHYVACAHDARPGGTLQLAVLLVPGGPPVGELIVCPAAEGDAVELALAIGAQHQRQGVATRTASAALDLARTRGARRALVTIDEGNHASAVVARVAGFAETDAPVQEIRRKGFVLHMRTWAREL